MNKKQTKNSADSAKTSIELKESSVPECYTSHEFVDKLLLLITSMESFKKHIKNGWKFEVCNTHNWYGIKVNAPNTTGFEPYNCAYYPDYYLFIVKDDLKALNRKLNMSAKCILRIVDEYYDDQLKGNNKAHSIKSTKNKKLNSLTDEIKEYINNDNWFKSAREYIGFVLDCENENKWHIQFDIGLNIPDEEIVITDFIKPDLDEKEIKTNIIIDIWNKIYYKSTTAFSNFLVNDVANPVGFNPIFGSIYTQALTKCIVCKDTATSALSKISSIGI